MNSKASLVVFCRSLLMNLLLIRVRLRIETKVGLEMKLQKRDWKVKAKEPPFLIETLGAPASLLLMRSINKAFQ